MPSGSAISRSCARCALPSRQVWWIDFDRRAGQLELAAGLQRNRALAGRLDEPDDVVLVEDRVPAQRALHALEQRADAALAAIGNRRVAVDVERKLFVLGADPPFVARLVAFGEIDGEFVDRFDRPEIGRVARHSLPPGASSPDFAR